MAARTRKLVGRKLAELVLALGAEDRNMGLGSRAEKLAEKCNALDKALAEIAGDA